MNGVPQNKLLMKQTSISQTTGLSYLLIVCVLFSEHTKRTIKYQSKRKRKNITEKIFEKKFQKSFTVVGGAAYPYIVVFGGEAGRLYLYKDIVMHVWVTLIY